MEHRRRRSRSRSPPSHRSGGRRSRWQERLRSQSRSRSRSPPRREARQQRAKSRSRSKPRNQDKKTRDFSNLVQCVKSWLTVAAGVSLWLTGCCDCRWGKQEDEEKEEEPVEVEKPNFGLTGALAKDQTTGNTQNGVVMKFSEPPEARRPTKRYRFYVFKDDKNIGEAEEEAAVDL